MAWWESSAVEASSSPSIQSPGPLLHLYAFIYMLVKQSLQAGSFVSPVPTNVPPSPTPVPPRPCLHLDDRDEMRLLEMNSWSVFEDGYMLECQSHRQSGMHAGFLFLGWPFSLAFCRHITWAGRWGMLATCHHGHGGCHACPHCHSSPMASHCHCLTVAFHYITCLRRHAMLAEGGESGLHYCFSCTPAAVTVLARDLVMVIGMFGMGGIMECLILSISSCMC